MINVKNRFGKNLRRIRTRENLTQEQFAEKIGLQFQSISNIEAGKHFASAETIDNICNVFKIHPIELFVDPSETKDLSDKEKLGVITGLMTNFDSNLLDYFYKMVQSVR